MQFAKKSPNRALNTGHHRRVNETQFKRRLAGRPTVSGYENWITIKVYTEDIYFFKVNEYQIKFIECVDKSVFYTSAPDILWDSTREFFFILYSTEIQKNTT